MEGSNWSSYKRKQVNIEKAVYNSEVNQQLTKHYKYLHNLLVKQDGEEDIFNDTYLKLTHQYNPDKDFISQFKYYFNLLKGAYYRDDKVANYQLTLIEDNVSIIQEPAVYQEELEADTKVKPSLEELKLKVQSYANTKKSQKRT